MMQGIFPISSKELRGGTSSLIGFSVMFPAVVMEPYARTLAYGRTSTVTWDIRTILCSSTFYLEVWLCSSKEEDWSTLPALSIQLRMRLSLLLHSQD